MNIITTYMNPDLDGIACMTALAKFLGADWAPARFGKIDFETMFVVEKLGLDAPRQLRDSANFADAEKIILVDTHHLAQLPQNFPTDRVVAVYDHHPNGDDEKFPNAKIDNRNIGAAATIIAEMYLNANRWDDKMLRLLGFAIMSNTNGLTSSIATDLDRNVYAKITERFPIATADVTAMLHARLRVLELGLRTALESDIKLYETARWGRVAIAQLKMPDLFSALDTDRVIAELGEIAAAQRVKYALLNSGDLTLNRAMVISANADTDKMLNDQFGMKTVNHIYRTDRILARKKDFVF